MSEPEIIDMGKVIKNLQDILYLLHQRDGKIGEYPSYLDPLWQVNAAFKREWALIW